MAADRSGEFIELSGPEITEAEIGAVVSVLRPAMVALGSNGSYPPVPVARARGGGRQ